MDWSKQLGVEFGLDALKLSLDLNTSITMVAMQVVSAPDEVNRHYVEQNIVKLGEDHNAKLHALYAKYGIDTSKPIDDKPVDTPSGPGPGVCIPHGKYLCAECAGVER